MNETDKQENPLKQAIEKIETGDWVYFIKKSPYSWDFGDVYKIRPDGTELTLLCYGNCEGLRIEGGQLHFTEWEDNDCSKGYTVEYRETKRSIPLDRLKVAP
jgi:hypothetical protein